MRHSHLHLGQLLHIGYFLDDNKVGNLYADSGLISSDGIFICKNRGVGYREKGYPEQDPKNDCLDFVKIETS